MDSFSSWKKITNVISAVKKMAGSNDKITIEKTVESQTEAARAAGDMNIWGAVLSADFSAIKRMFEQDPQVLHLRGSVGELPVHLCMLYKSDKHVDIGKWMIAQSPDLVSTIYEGPEYYGENILHIAVINRNIELCRLLVDKDPTLLSGRATGRFFSPDGAFGFGEYPIFFAACTNQKDITEILLEAGGDISVTDGNGSTVFHHLVKQGNLHMFDFLCEYYSSHREIYDPTKSLPLPWKVVNNDGLTPFTYAAYLGNEKMFKAMLERRKELQWQYGSVTCNLYPLDELDTSLNVKTKFARVKPAIHWIVSCEHLHMLQQSRIAELFRKKWERFAEKIFLQKMFMTVLYIVVYTLASILRPAAFDYDGAQNEDLYQHSSKEKGIMSAEGKEYASSSFHVQEGVASTSIGDDAYTLGLIETDFLSLLFTFYSAFALYIFCEGFVVVGGLYKAYRELSEIRRAGIVSHFQGSGSLFVENVTSGSYVTTLFLSYLFQMISPTVVPEWFYSHTRAIAGVLLYSYMLFFFLGFRLTGPFLVIVGRMATVDLVRFFTLFSVFLLGFAQGFFTLFEEVGFSEFVERVRKCFMTIMGILEDEEYNFSWLAIIFIVTYSIIAVILLLNLLVAEMGDTYSKMVEDADRQWMLERARIIFSIEHEMSEEERSKEDNKYWISIGGKRYIQVEEIDETWGVEPDDPTGMERMEQNIAELKDQVRHLQTLLEKKGVNPEEREDKEVVEEEEVEEERAQNDPQILENQRETHRQQKQNDAQEEEVEEEEEEVIEDTGAGVVPPEFVLHSRFFDQVRSVAKERRRQEEEEVAKRKAREEFEQERRGWDVDKENAQNVQNRVQVDEEGFEITSTPSGRKRRTSQTPNFRKMHTPLSARLRKTTGRRTSTRAAPNK